MNTSDSLPEPVILGYIRQLAEHLGLTIYHTHDSRGSDPGFPDLVIVGRAVLWRELKPEHGNLRFYQRLWARRLRDAGQNFGIWRPADWHSGQIQRELEILAPPNQENQLMLFEEVA